MKGEGEDGNMWDFYVLQSVSQLTTNSPQTVTVSTCMCLCDKCAHTVSDMARKGTEIIMNAAAVWCQSTVNCPSLSHRAVRRQREGECYVSGGQC